MGKKELVVKYRSLVSVACRAHNLRNLLRTKKGSGNTVEAPCALLKKVGIRISGTGNRIIVEDFSTLKDVSIYIHGSNNTVYIGPWSHLIGTDICIENDHNEISLGRHCWMLGKVHLAAIEGTRITVGEDCLFSGDIHFRTGDSHSILDMQGKRVNPSEDIVLGDHVWVGTQAMCLKGARVADHSIIGTRALVTGRFDTPHCVLAGVPARVVREGADWSLKRIGVGQTAADFSPVR